VITTAPQNAQRPFTMNNQIRQAQNPSGAMGHASQSVTLSEIEPSSMQQGVDPRRALKEKKQKLQFGFYETLR
jgi:hypothetical protein